MAEIALFGGSFDPPHVGHLLAAAWVLATEPVDELWFVPVHEHPLGKKMAAPFEHRVELCQLAIADLGLRRARVSRIEEDLGGEGRTVDLLEHLHQSRPGDRFALVLGTDLKFERSQWKRFERIEELARIIEVWRGGYPNTLGTRIAADAAHHVPDKDVGQQARADGVDAHRRQELVGGPDVRSWPAELPAAALALDHLAVEIERPPQQHVRRLDAAFEDEFADLGGGADQAVHGHRRHQMEAYSALLQREAQRLHRAGAALAVGEVVSDDDLGNPRGEEQVDESRRLQ